jgi:hypothetical protein
MHLLVLYHATVLHNLRTLIREQLLIPLMKVDGRHVIVKQMAVRLIVSNFIHL